MMMKHQPTSSVSTPRRMKTSAPRPVSELNSLMFGFRPSEHLFYAFVRVMRLAIVALLLPLRQIDLLSGQLFIRNLAEQMRNYIEPSASLVVGSRDVPRRIAGVGRHEHV